MYDYFIDPAMSKVSFFHQCSKMQIIPIKEFNIKTCFIQVLWFFRLKFLFKGQMIHLNLPNAYKLLCFDRNSNGNRDFLSGTIGHCTEGRISLYTLKSSIHFSLVFFSIANQPKISPNIIFFSIKMAGWGTSIRWPWLYVLHQRSIVRLFNIIFNV